jgi:hypothetical protein
MVWPEGETEIDGIGFTVTVAFCGALEQPLPAVAVIEYVAV